MLSKRFWEGKITFTKRANTQSTQKYLSIIITSLLVIGLGSRKTLAQFKLDHPIPLPASNLVSDFLSEKDIFLDEDGFARDYLTKFNQGDYVLIELSSHSFDTVVTLFTTDGIAVGENDDGPDRTTNSLLFTRIKKTGSYVLRVQSYGESGIGRFQLKVTRLRPI